MPTVEELLGVLGKAFDEAALLRTLGAEGRAIPSNHERGHPEDERHYYVVPDAGLELLLDADARVSVLYFMFEAGPKVRAYPWVLNGCLGRGSSRADVRAHLGVPVASGEGIAMLGIQAGAWDRFVYAPFGQLHAQFSIEADRLAMLTAMTAERAAQTSPA